MTASAAEVVNPCLACGACCASFRVSFYWAEADELHIPESLTEKINDRFLCMHGTNDATPRCVALVGEVGTHVSCQIYLQRPSPCHDVQVGDEHCVRARSGWRLSALLS